MWNSTESHILLSIVNILCNRFNEVGNKLILNFKSVY